MKNKHNLSGMYFRQKNEDSGNYENVCFEDLERSVQEQQMAGRGEEWLKSMVLNLSDRLHAVAEQFDIFTD